MERGFVLSVAAIRNAGVAWLNLVLLKVRSCIYVKRGGRLKKAAWENLYVILAKNIYIYILVYMIRMYILFSIIKIKIKQFFSINFQEAVHSWQPQVVFSKNLRFICRLWMLYVFSRQNQLENIQPFDVLSLRQQGVPRNAGPPKNCKYVWMLSTYTHCFYITLVWYTRVELGLI